MGVEESKTGTIPSAEEQAKVASEAKGKTPGDASKVSPKEDPKLYSQKEADALVHSAKSEAGRDFKELESKVTSLTAQIQNKEEDITENTAEIGKLQARIDDLSSDDPKRFDAIKEMKVAQEERRQLKLDRRTLEDDKRTHGERLKQADETLRETTIWNISAEYEGSDQVKLKDLCDTFEAKSEEQIRKVAETLWVKKSEPATPSVLPLSGVTDGGSDRLGDKSPKDALKAIEGKLRT